MNSFDEQLRVSLNMDARDAPTLRVEQRLQAGLSFSVQRILGMGHIPRTSTSDIALVVADHEPLVAGVRAQVHASVGIDL